jgi:hypothetical protein
MTLPSAVLLRGGLGLRIEFIDGQPTFYAGSGRDGVINDLGGNDLCFGMESKQPLATP